MTAPVLRRVAFVAALLGVIDAAYLSYEHLTSSTTLACSDSGVVNCLKVTTSSYADLLGIPVAFLGLAYFVVMGVWCAPPAWRSHSTPVRRGRIVAVVLGVAMVIYLVWAELFALDAICLWCSVIHLLTLVLFAAVVLEAPVAATEAEA